MSDKPRQEMGLPRMFDAVPVCPAGEQIGETLKGSGVLCRLTDSPVLSQENPHSLLFCCTQTHRQCPVWIAEKQRIEQNRRSLYVETVGV